MTTGNKTLLSFATMAIPSYGNVPYGTSLTKVWSGGDSVTATVKRSSFPDAKIVPKRPPERVKPVYGMVRYGGRDHFIKIGKSPKKGRQTGRTSKETGLVYNPLTRLYEIRPVEKVADLRREWLKKLATRKSLPPNSYTMTKTRTEQSIWRCWYGSPAFKSYNYMYSVPPGSTGFPTPVIDVSNEYKLLDKIRSKVYGSGFNPGIFLAEAPMAISMIGNAAYRLGAAIHRFKHGDWRGMFQAFGVEPRQIHKFLVDGSGKRRGHSDYQWRDSTKKISGLWLELAYGWRPLLDDMEDGAAWIAYSLNPPINDGGTVSGRRAWEVSHFRQASNNGNLTFMNRKITYKLQIRIKGVVVSPSYSIPSLPSLAAVAWELVPFSFVVDWAAPIGSYLQALRTARDIRGTVVRTLCTETVYSNVAPGGTDVNDYHPIYRVAGVDDRLTIFTVERTVSTELKVPSPLTAFVDGHAIFSNWRRTANAIALLVQGDFRSLARGFSNQR